MNVLLSSDSNEWAQLTPKSLFQQIKADLKAYYDWDLNTDSMDATLEQYSLQKISLLRYRTSSVVFSSEEFVE